MVDKVIPYLINLGDIVPARSKASLLNEMAIALIECINIYGKKISKLGKINKIACCFWPVRLIPLNETRACVCSYLLNKQEKLPVGKFAQTLPKPDNVITGADANSFLASLQSYNDNYLKKTKNFKRGILIQEALFNTNEIEYFKNFFLNQYDLNSFGEPYFLLEGDPIAKSVNQIKIIQEVYDFVSLKDIKMLDNYATIITNISNKWITKGSQVADKIKGTTIDTKNEEKQLALLNQELQREKERDLGDSPEALLKSGKYKISDKTSEFLNQINAFKNSVERLRNAINKRDLFLLEEGLKELDLKYSEIGNSISRYKTEIDQLKKNLEREKGDIQNIQQKKITELERKISEVEKQIEAKHEDLNKELANAEDIVVQIKQERQACLDNIEMIKDIELTNVQNFFKNYTIEIKTQNIAVGIPIFIFYFVDPNSSKTTERAPVFPILIEKGRIVTTKIKESFRSKIRDLMNKYNPMINLVESQGDKCNLMKQIKNLDTRLEDSINNLRMSKVLNKKQAARAVEIINNLVW
ncbi:MAG: hypothetical protein ACTSQJ_02475 [Promethearchaeota archaeon]